jgi:hypothetical protein
LQSDAQKPRAAEAQRWAKEKKSMKDKFKIKFDLIENARDSLCHTVELLAWKEIRSGHARLKQAIMSSAHCIELLLKERLRRINPAFVWENVDKYPSLEARTVTVDTAISRLKRIGRVEVASKDETNIKALRKTRNAIEHYEWVASEKEAKVIIGNALSFAISFAQEELETDLSSEFKRDDTWRSLMDELYEFVRAHGQRLEAKLREQGDHPSYCDACGELTVSSRGGSCDLCGHWQAIDDET